MMVDLYKELDSFLTSKEPTVLAIKGEWGVGKTHYWKDYLKCKCNRKELLLEKYSYVSLFGIASLQQFKNAIFINRVNIKNPKQKDNIISMCKAMFNKPIFNMFKDKEMAITWLKSIPNIAGVSSIVEPLMYNDLKDTIICIDDLERVGDGLAIKDVLGLITDLAEEKNCKAAYFDLTIL